MTKTPEFGSYIMEIKLRVNPESGGDAELLRIALLAAEHLVLIGSVEEVVSTTILPDLKHLLNELPSRTTESPLAFANSCYDWLDTWANGGGNRSVADNVVITVHARLREEEEATFAVVTEALFDVLNNHYDEVTTLSMLTPMLQQVLGTFGIRHNIHIPEQPTMEIE